LGLELGTLQKNQDNGARFALYPTEPQGSNLECKLAVRPALAMGEVVQRAGRVFLRPARN
jgi:hypothetical protein